MKKILFILTFLMFISSVFAQGDIEAMVGEASEDVVGQKVPGVLGKVFGDEQINFHIAKKDGSTVIVGLVTKDKVVESLAVGEVEDPSLNVYLDEAVLNELQTSDNPVAVLEQAMDEDRVTYKAVGFFNKIKFAFLRSFSSIVRLFTIDDDADVEFEKLPEAEEETPAEESEEPSGDEVTGSVVEEVVTEDPVEEVELEEPEETAEEPEELVEESGPKNHVVKMKVDGFEPSKLFIKVGDTVIWENDRAGKAINKAMLVGAQRCYKIKSGFMEAGDIFSWKFEEPGKCVFVDGIVTTLVSEVMVEE